MSYTTDSNGRSTASLEVPTTVSAGAALDVHRLKGPHEISFQDVGTGTYDVQFTYRSTDAGWRTAATVTSDSTVSIALSPRQIRIKTTAYTSGTPTAIAETVA